MVLMIMARRQHNQILRNLAAEDESNLTEKGKEQAVTLTKV